MPRLASRSLISLALLAVPAAVSAQSLISVGENVRISTEYSNLPHAEYWADASPVDPNHMIACSYFYRKVGAGTGETDTLAASGSIIYASRDGGKTWKKTLEVLNSGDPACTYGLADTAFFLVLRLNFEAKKRPPMEVYRSVDGGMTWEKPVDVPWIDREYLAVDRSGGPYHGRLYINGTGGVRPITSRAGPGSTITLFRSSDGGKTFNGPALRQANDSQHVLGMGNSVVLSDGAVVSVFGLLREYDVPGRSGVQKNRPGSPNALLEVAISADGGERYDEVATVGDFYMAWPPDWTAVIPGIAADATTGAFKDRLYVVWPDERSGRSEILFSFSSDKGKTWSPARVINDDPPPANPTSDQSHMLPVVAVNKNGVVGIAWYDRRGITDLGWNLRFTASLDGGETFAPSVLVSSAPNRFDGHEIWPMNPFGSSTGNPRDSSFSLYAGVEQGFWYVPGHTSGIMADANGVFHPVWGDNRTGILQMWTAPITVNGQAARYGSSELAEYANLAGRVELVLSDRRMDQLAKTVRFKMRLKNVTQSDTVFGPIKLRITELTSAIGEPTIGGAENGLVGAGAVIDLSNMLIGGRLNPGDTTASRDFEIRLADLRPFKQGESVHTGLFSLKASLLAKRVLGPPRPPAAKTP